MEKKTDISLEDCQGWSIKVKINDAGKVVTETGCTQVIVKMHDGDVVFDGAESLERLAEDMLNVCALRKALDVAIDSLEAIQDWDADNPKEPFNRRPYQVRAIQNFAQNKSREIKRIMKGEKE